MIQMTPYADGYRASETLKMTISNVKFYIDPKTLVTGETKITEMKEAIAGNANLDNLGPTTDKVTSKLSYQLNTTTSHASTYKFAEGLGIKETFKFNGGLPGIASTEKSTELSFTFTAEQGWTDTEQKTVSNTFETAYTGDVPANSRRHLQLIAVTNKAEIPYNAKKLC
ncbi:aerolysin family beta-barrel pore-forming toxin [Clostridium sp. Marseille-Q2269]|uniref:aerolysin family beta-barrel pore-forming toxin n=1 Tax=Clostridium sp. Marseille-Q2269 TaxID=2942205 RepID=UPI002072DD8E|nr:aerolysin family beta-barrel pore-forming toxin [Clostridium sp. Marseille-Q2269]